MKPNRLTVDDNITKEGHFKILMSTEITYRLYRPITKKQLL